MYCTHHSCPWLQQPYMVLLLLLTASHCQAALGVAMACSTMPWAPTTLRQRQLWPPCPGLSIVSSMALSMGCSWDGRASQSGSTREHPTQLGIALRDRADKWQRDSFTDLCVCVCAFAMPWPKMRKTATKGICAVRPAAEPHAVSLGSTSSPPVLQSCCTWPACSSPSPLLLLDRQRERRRHRPSGLVAAALDDFDSLALRRQLPPGLLSRYKPRRAHFRGALQAPILPILRSPKSHFWRLRERKRKQNTCTVSKLAYAYPAPR